MLRLASDADLDGRLYSGLRRRDPTLDIIRVQDVGLRTAPDPDILAWAATEGRIVVTHDKDTMPGFAYDRVRAGLPMPGLVVVSREVSLGQQIMEVLIFAHCSNPGEWEGQVVFLPL